MKTSEERECATVVVVPAHNEADRLNVMAFLQFLERTAGVELLFVDDGSTDDTLQLLSRMQERCPQRISVQRLDRCQGKAAAVRHGMLAAVQRSVDFVGYWDADLATPLGELPRFLEVFAEHPEIELVLGSRIRLLGRSIDRRWLRHYAGRLFATAASWALRLPVYDTQCGAKLFRATPGVEGIFRDPFLSGWAFDVELLARYLRAHPGDGASRIYELPLNEWRDVPGSKVRPWDLFRALLALLRIRARYRSSRAWTRLNPTCTRDASHIR